MTAFPTLLLGFTPISDKVLPVSLARALPANSQIAKGQFATVDPTTGLASLNDGTVPNQISAGNGDFEISDSSPVDGLAGVRLNQRMAYGLVMSSSSNDGFSDSDFGTPFFIASENSLGKLSNSGGSNRSLGGLVFGLNFAGDPVFWAGPIAQLLARATLMTNGIVGGSKDISTAAGTDTAEVALTREKLHGVVTSIEFVGGAIAADATNYVTVTISKRDGAGGGAVTVGTLDSRTANQGAVSAWQPKAFALSGTAAARNVLETDILTIAVTHGGTGQAIAGNFRVVQKVI